MTALLKSQGRTRKKDFRLSLLVCCGIALAGCGVEPKSPPIPETLPSGGNDAIRQITIHTATGWLLTIESDGSGSIGYGSSAQDFAPFARGTFDFAAIRDTLLPISVPTGSIRKDFAVTFARAGETSATAVYISSAKAVHELFETAFSSAEKSRSRVEELYSLYPPVPGTHADSPTRRDRSSQEPR